MEKKLMRSRTERSIAGVCGGFAKYLNVDVTAIRLLAIFLLLTGSGFFLYLAAWALMPEESSPYR